MTAHARAALRAALREASEDLLAYFERRVRVREDAADLLGETMLQAWRRHGALPDDPTRQRMWLFRIAANVLANHERSRRRRTALSDRLRDHLATAASRPDLADANAVRDAVLRLGDGHRELVMLIHWDGFTIGEAAELLGLNPSTARGRYAAARQTLKEALTDPVCAAPARRTLGT
ncbi:RNA polymerase subunit sigma-24 [Nocardioides sp. Soil805]|nr:RNA polymerase subunit sigma-24 [Nocardioides sp. Soil805]